VTLAGQCGELCILGMARPLPNIRPMPRRRGSAIEDRDHRPVRGHRLQSRTHQLVTHRLAPGCEATGCIALLCRLRSRTDMAHGRRIRIIGYFLLLATRRAIGSSSAIHGCSPLTLSGGSSTPSVTGTRTPDPLESNGRAPEQAGKIRAVGHQRPSSRNLRSPAAGSQSPGHLARVS
jgi:hypothetical protein